MANKNRMANTQNKYQGDMKKVLCVCSAGLLRSPTIAWILSNPPFNYNTRACGASDEYALIPIDEALVYWADEIVCVEGWQASKAKIIADELNLDTPIHHVPVEDDYETRDPKLVELVTPRLIELFKK